MAKETDPRGEWDVISPQGQKFVRVIAFATAAANDTCVWKLKSAIGATPDLASGVSPTQIAITAGVGYTITIAGASMPGAASPLSAPYFHYFEVLDNTGAPKLTMAGSFTYPERERIPLVSL